MPMPSLSSVAASRAFVAHVLGDAVSMFGKSVVCLKIGNLPRLSGHSNAKMMISLNCIWYFWGSVPYFQTNRPEPGCHRCQTPIKTPPTSPHHGTVPCGEPVSPQLHSLGSRILCRSGIKTCDAFVALCLIHIWSLVHGIYGHSLRMSSLTLKHRSG